MSTYTDIFDDVVRWTKRPLLINETNMAIRQALRSAHKAGSFYRDLVQVPITGLSTSDAVQQIDLNTWAPNFRQIATFGPTGYDIRLEEVEIRDLFQDGYPKTNVFYGMGTYLMVRAEQPFADYTLTYYTYPVVSPIEGISSWIAVNHQELIVLWAAATILTLVGEQEIKTRVEGLAKIAYDDLISDNVRMIGN